MRGSGSRALSSILGGAVTLFLISVDNYTARKKKTTQPLCKKQRSCKKKDGREGQEHLYLCSKLHRSKSRTEDVVAFSAEK
ncbi:hypothetical protein QOT17_25582 [Balamuthia mandrillaris]